MSLHLLLFDSIHSHRYVIIFGDCVTLTSIDIDVHVDHISLQAYMSHVDVKILSLELLGSNNKLVGGCDVHTYFSIFHVNYVHHNPIFLLVLANLYEFWIIGDYMDFIQILQNMSKN